MITYIGRYCFRIFILFIKKWPYKEKVELKLYFYEIYIYIYILTARIPLAFFFGFFCRSLAFLSACASGK